MDQSEHHVPSLLDDEAFVMISPGDEETRVARIPSLASICRYVDELSDALRSLSLDIHDNPELQYKEFHAHEILTKYLAKQKGWQVTPSAYDIKTAFVAVFDTGKPGPVVSFNAEYDALKGIGHACGHNLIAIVSVGAALATATAMNEHDLTGTVVLFGTPAEGRFTRKHVLIEYLLDRGLADKKQKEVEAKSSYWKQALIVTTRTAAYASFKVEYFGREAHAAARPWDGINALDALITAYNAISVLRQQTQPGDIIQGHITNGGLRPNIIHAYSSGMFVVRSSSLARLNALKKRVLACFDAGATATGATLKVTAKGAYDDHAPNRSLGARYRHAFNQLGGDIPDAEIDYITASTTASTDQGNISHAMPSISPNFWIRSEDDAGNQLGGPHTPDFERAARSEESHKLALTVAKSLAATAVDVLTQPELLKAIKREFEATADVSQ